MSASNAPDLVRTLNSLLAWELRAQTLYSHYASYIKGIHRLHLRPFFETEAAESVVHATTVRDHIAKLGGEACTQRDQTEIVHTTDYRVMLDEAMKTETRAAAGYKELLDMPGIGPELRDAMEQVFFQEDRAVDELNQLIES